MGSLPKPSIPTLDFSPWHTSPPGSPARQHLADALITACREIGFVTILNHGLAPTLLAHTFSTSRTLFSLPHTQKMLAPHPPGPSIHRGYSSPGLEKVSQYSGGDQSVGEALRQISDCKESYEVGSEDNTLQPNVWLPEHVLPGFKQVTTEMYWACNAVAQEILKAIALGLGLDDEEFLARMHSGHYNQLRLLHYPAVPAADLEEERVARMPAHSDWGTVTMLFQDDCGGLEVEDPREKGRFMHATPVPGACIVNVGDLLMRWSNDCLKSTLHRVTLPPLSDRFEGEHRMTRERFSIPYFVTCDPETVVECLPVCTDEDRPVKYEPVTQAAYSQMRGKLQYRSSDTES